MASIKDPIYKEISVEEAVILKWFRALDHKEQQSLLGVLRQMSGLDPEEARKLLQRWGGENGFL